MKIVIVGGVAGGATAAARLRRNDENAEIIVFEKGPYMSFANCGLPYHISGVIEDREALLLQNPVAMKSRYNVDVRVETEVVSVDKDRKVVTYKNLPSGATGEESYDKLILSPGASPIMPPIPGIDSSHIFTLRNVPDTDKIIAHIKNENVKNAVVIGGGFIGVELAENFNHLGMDVSLVEAQDQIMAPFDKDIISFAHQEMKNKGVNLILSNGVSRFEDTDNGINVILANGETISTSLVVMAIGVRPETGFLKDSGIKLEKNGAITADQYLRTSDEDVYALGDAIFVNHFIGGAKAMIPLAWPANRQGRMVADTITGKKDRKYLGTLGTSIIKIFDMAFASTGHSEKALKSLNIDYKVVTVIRGHHVGYYPGMKNIILKLIFKDDGTVLGAQACGEAGVDKRIDVISMAIKSGAKVWDLEDFEPCYAPPFGAAKDPINIAAYAAENIIDGTVKSVTAMDLANELDSNSEIIDLRDEKEFSAIPMIDGAINIPVNDLRDKLNTLDKSKKYIVACKVGLRGYLGALILQSNGFNAVNLSGGMLVYSTYKNEF